MKYLDRDLPTDADAEKTSGVGAELMLNPFLKINTPLARTYQPGAAAHGCVLSTLQAEGGVSRPV